MNIGVILLLLFSSIVLSSVLYGVGVVTTTSPWTCEEYPLAKNFVYLGRTVPNLEAQCMSTTENPNCYLIPKTQAKTLCPIYISKYPYVNYEDEASGQQMYNEMKTFSCGKQMKEMYNTTGYDDKGVQWCDQMVNKNLIRNPLTFFDKQKK